MFDMKTGKQQNTNIAPLSKVTKAFLDNHAFIRKFLSRYLSNQQDIEDVAQEAYLHAFAAEQRKENGIDKPRAFLFRVAKNLAISRLRRKSHQITEYIEELSLPADPGDATDPEREMAARQALGLYCEAVAALPEKCRQIFLLRKVHGLKHHEIAERLSISISSVEKYLRKGLIETRAYLREREEFHESPCEARSRKENSLADKR